MEGYGDIAAVFGPLVAFTSTVNECKCDGQLLFCFNVIELLVITPNWNDLIGP